MAPFEDAQMEYKREYTPNIIKTIIAFANTDGGTIVVGVDDAGRVVGVDDLDVLMQRVSNAVRDSIIPDVTSFVQYHVERMDDRHVLRIIVQRGASLPYYLREKGVRPEGVYVRQGNESVPASDTAILMMIRESAGESYEDLSSPNQDLTFDAAQRRFDERGLAFGPTQRISLGITSTKGVYTNLGLLLSDQCAHTLKIAVFQGTTKSVFIDRREIGGSLFDQLDDALAFIDRYNRTSSEIEGLYRIDRRDYNPIAVREALLNALIHRDYSFRDSSLISLFDDRIEYLSIGGLLRGISYAEVMQGVSMARNPKLANVFYRLKLVEAYGTGILKIMDCYRDEDRKPAITTTPNSFKLELPSAILHRIQRPLPQAAPATVPGMMPDRRQEQALALIAAQGSMSRKELQQSMSLSQVVTTRLLRELRDAGLVVAVGAGHHTRYALPR